MLSSEPGNYSYKTDHFSYYYDQNDLSYTQIERIGLRNEQFLKNINAYLGTEYNRTIEVFISSTHYRASVGMYERVYMTVDEALNDKGSRIAKSTIGQELGRSEWGILDDGVPGACVTDDKDDAMKIYLDQVKYGNKKDAQLIQKITVETDSFLKKLENDEWNETYQELIMAGAFIHYLKKTYGIEMVKAWYKTDDNFFDNPSEAFLSIFGLRCSIVIENFKNTLIKRI